MPQDKQSPQQNQSEEQKNRANHQTVRGEDLRSKMIESEEYGEDYRADHQGQDERLPDQDHEKGRARTWDKDEPQKKPLSEKPTH